jgi:two-component system chemotaxis response regulator CheY
VARVLVVDDNSMVRLYIKENLMQAGHEIVGEADDGAKAVDEYIKCRPDIVTLDITMPRRDGLESLKDIMAADPDAKIIMCTAISAHPVIVGCLRIGAKDYIVKPFTPDELVHSVEKVLGQ